MKLDKIVDNKIKTRQIELLFRNATLSYSITLVNAVLVYTVLDDLVPRIELLIWLIAIIGVTLLRLLLVSAYWNARRPYGRIILYKNLHLCGVYFTAALWGSLIFIPGQHSEIWVESFITVVLSGITTGGVLALSPLLTAIIPFLALILVPLAVFFFQSGDFPHLAMGIMVSFYLLLLTRLVFNNHNLVVETIRQQAGNKTLFEFLEKAKKETERQQTLLENRITNLQGDMKDKASYFDLLDLPVLITTLDGTIRDVNLALLRTTGRDEEDIIGIDITSLVAGPDRTRVQSLLEEQQAGLLSERAQFRFHPSDGSSPQFEWEPIRHENLLYWTGLPVRH